MKNLILPVTMLVLLALLMIYYLSVVDVSGARAERVRAWETKLNEIDGICKPRGESDNRFQRCYAAIRYTLPGGVRETAFVHAIHANGEPYGFYAPNQMHATVFLGIDPKTVSVVAPANPAFPAMVKQYLDQTATD